MEFENKNFLIKNQKNLIKSKFLFFFEPQFFHAVLKLLGGEAASLREAPLPQTPSPEERLAFEVRLSS